MREALVRSSRQKSACKTEVDIIEKLNICFLNSQDPHARNCTLTVGKTLLLQLVIKKVQRSMSQPSLTEAIINWVSLYPGDSRSVSRRQLKLVFRIQINSQSVILYFNFGTTVDMIVTSDRVWWTTLSVQCFLFLFSVPFSLSRVMLCQF